MAIVSSVSAPELRQLEENTPGTSTDEGTETDSGSGSEDLREVKAVPRNFTAPKVWMILFGVVLAFCAGTVDVITLRGLQVFVSHVTGTVAKIGARLEGVTTGLNESWDLYHAMLLVGCFIIGAFLCGLVIPKNQVHFGGKSFYGVALLGNSCLLIIAGCVSPQEKVTAENVTQSRAIVGGCLSAMACGLQNAMCTMHFGAIVRTTHVTGTATDIGSTAGRAAAILLRTGCSWRRASILERADLLDDATKLGVLMCIFTGFLCGTIFGAMLHHAIGIRALFVPAGVTGFTGFLYSFFRSALKRQIKRLEELRLQDEIAEVDQVLERTRSYLANASPEQRKELEGILDESLRAAHDVEERIAEICRAPGTLAVDRARSF